MGIERGRCDVRTFFDASEFAHQKRVDAWRAAVTDTFVPIGVEDYSRADFNARYETFRVDDIALSRFQGSAQTFHRSPRLIRRRDADFYVCVIQQDGEVSTEHFGHTGAGLRASITLIDVTKPYRIKVDGALDWLAVHVPRHKLDRALGATHTAVGLSIGPEQASTALIRNYFSKLMSTGESLPSMVGGRVASIGVDLLAAGFAERIAADPPISQGTATVIYRAKSVIEKRLADPELDTATIAATLGLSPRRLQEIFQAAELSVEESIWERRLLHARRLLADPLCAAMTIATISNLCGFVSQAHFTRRFKARFGVTPTEHRASPT
jgi:AraC family transcriptional regulator, positive regulator of tynA and feaB